jgi:HlyD family secretion protein
VKEGDFVKAGTFLMEIDPVRSKAQVQSLEANLQATSQELESAKARLLQGRADFRRAEANHKAGIISAADYEQIRTAFVTAENSERSAHRRVEQARADLAGAKDSLSKCTIVAPMDGLVTARKIEQGETAVPGVQNQPGTVLLTISDMEKVEAELEVDEASIPGVKLGQTAQVRIDAYPNQVFEALVTEVGGSPITKLTQNEATKFKVKVQMKNPPSSIKPGLSAQADILTGRREKALAIPLQALVMKESKPAGPAKEGVKVESKAKEEEGVFVLTGGTAKFMPVKTGLLGDLNVEVLEGLQGGETLITGPFKAIRDLKGGEKVQVDKSKKKEEKK